MSGIEGLAKLQGRLDRLQELAKDRLDKAVETGGRQMREDMVALAPSRTGNLRAVLGSEDALKFKKGSKGLEVSVGFVSKKLKRDAFYALFVETGTKGYVAGQTRAAGTDKKGRKRVQRIKRNIPARPAQPFFRPALANLKRNMDKLRKEAWAKAAGDMLLGG